MKKQKFQSHLFLFLSAVIFAVNFSIVSDLFAEFPFFSKTGSIPSLPSLIKPKNSEQSDITSLFNAGGPIVSLTISPNYKYLAVQTLQNRFNQPDPVTGMCLNKAVNVWNIEYNLPFKEAETELGPLTWIMDSAFGDKGRSFYVADYSKSRTTMSGSISGPINIRKINLEEKKHYHSLLFDTGFQKIRLFKGNQWYACQAWNGTWRLINVVDTGRIINFPDIDISKDPGLRPKTKVDAKSSAEKNKTGKNVKSKEASSTPSKDSEKETEKILSKEEIKKELREELLAELKGKIPTTQIVPNQSFPAPASPPLENKNAEGHEFIINTSNSKIPNLSDPPGFSESSNITNSSGFQKPVSQINSNPFNKFNNAGQIITASSNEPDQIPNTPILEAIPSNKSLDDREVLKEKNPDRKTIVPNLKKVPEIDPKNRRKVVDILAISESGDLVATLISDGGEAWEDYIALDSPPSIPRTIVIWDLKVVSEINYKKLDIPLEAIEVARFVVEDGVEPRKCVFSKSGTMIAIRSKSRYVGIWETASGKLLSELGEHKQNIRTIDFSPNNLKIVVGTGGNRACLVLWDIRKETVLRIYEEKNPEVKNITAVSFDPDSRIIYYGNDCGEVKSWFVGKKKSQDPNTP